MAVFYSEVKYGYQLKLTIEETSTSVENNTSTVSCKLELLSGVNHFSNYEIGANIEIDGTGYSSTAYRSIAQNSSLTLLEPEPITIAHDSDGSKTINVTFSMNAPDHEQAWEPDDMSKTISMELTPITRYCTLTCVAGTGIESFVCGTDPEPSGTDTHCTVTKADPPNIVYTTCIAQDGHHVIGYSGTDGAGNDFETIEWPAYPDAAGRVDGSFEDQAAGKIHYNYWNMTCDRTMTAHAGLNKVKISYNVQGGTLSSPGYSVNSYGHITDGSGDPYFHILEWGQTDDPYSFILTKTGYQFAGWQVRGTDNILEHDERYDCTWYTQYDDRYKSVANTKEVICYLDAVWEPNIVKIIYNSVGGKLPQDSEYYIAPGNSGHICTDNVSNHTYPDLSIDSDDFHILKYNESTTLSNFGLTKTGYQFAGWKLHTSDTILYLGKSYDSTYFHQSGITDSNTENTDVVWCGLNAVWVPNIVHIIYSANGGEIQEDSDYGIAEDGQIYYKYGEEDHLEEFHTLKYGDEDSPYDAATFKLYRNGYTFKGWRIGYAVDNGGVLDQSENYDSTEYFQAGNRYETTANVADGVVWCALNAEWVQDTYTITYRPGYSGTGHAFSVSTTYGAAIALPGESFERAGYTQTGWHNVTYDCDYELCQSLGEGFGFDRSCVLEPIWTANTYKLTFNANGGINKAGGNFDSEIHAGSSYGETRSSVTVTYDSPDYYLMYNNNPTRPGYNFLGWYTSADGVEQIYNEGGYAVPSSFWRADGDWKVWNSPSDQTVYARWELVGSVNIPSEGKQGIPYVYVDGEWRPGILYVYYNKKWQMGR